MDRDYEPHAALAREDANLTKVNGKKTRAIASNVLTARSLPRDKTLFTGPDCTYEAWRQETDSHARPRRFEDAEEWIDLW
jgi:hypothetical protein